MSMLARAVLALPPSSFHPQVHLHPTPYALRPTPYALLASPYALRPSPYTLHPTPYTLVPTPYTLAALLLRSPDNPSS
eukprot:2585969-Rhodomonas_salina.1